ncbi:hypothetical protein ABXV18_27120 [Vibrio owensii]|uniref:hypothetical protein n=1 Tax=Vibrio owensii TaxID=696485 RepID=UPI00339326E1
MEIKVIHEGKHLTVGDKYFRRYAPELVLQDPKDMTVELFTIQLSGLNQIEIDELAENEGIKLDRRKSRDNMIADYYEAKFSGKDE